MPGALLTFGDRHYAQGDGEVLGTAVERTLTVQLTVNLLKKRQTSIPRIESADALMSVGSARPLEDAARVAYKDMVRWSRELTGVTEMNAYSFVSQNAQTTIAQMVDAEYTVLTRIPKGRLPRKK